MKLPFCSLVLPAVISVLTLQLSGCGEGSSNLVDPVPVAEQQSNIITSCDSAKELCTSGQFIDEPVVALNYECNQVKGLTDKEGVFTCPNNSVVSFYLQAEKGKYRINLGSYLLKAVGNVSGLRQSTLVQITPKDIVKDGSDSSGTYTVQISNILRLLQVLDSDGNNESSDVLRRIVISEAEKSKIDLLESDIAASIFADNDLFIQKIQPFLTAIGKTLPNVQSAIDRFNKSLPVLQSGVYEVSPFVVGTVDKTNKKLYTGMLGETTQSNIKAIEGLFFILDRDAKSIGLGVEWQDTQDSAEINTTLLQKILFDKQPKPLVFTSENMGFDTAGKIKSGFKLLADNGDAIEITQGVMLKGNILGNDFFYRNVYGLASTEAVDVTKLGKWKRTGSLALEGTANISKTRNVSPFLDDTIWKTKDNDAKPIFPLHLKLTFRDSDVKTCSTTSGCTVGIMGISILENGNIITDLNNNCRAVTNLMEQADPAFPTELLIQEHRLGLVTAAFKDTTSGSAISPILLVSDWAKNDPTWSKFYGIYLGTQSGATGGPKVQINIASVRDKIVSIENQKDDQAAGSGVNAIWTNYIKFLTAFSTKPVDAQTLAANQAQGIISKIEVQDCNAFLK